MVSGQRILVTGAAGRIGRALRPRLARPGRTLRLLDIAEIAPAEPGEDVEIVRASFTDPVAIDAACRDVDAVLHLGGEAGEAPWERIRELNIDGTLRVLEAACRHGVPRVVLASSIHAAGFRTRDDADRTGTGTNCAAAGDPAVGGFAAHGPARNGAAVGATAVHGAAANGTAANGTAATGTATRSTAPHGTAVNAAVPRPRRGLLPADTVPRPDTYYGASKAALEALGALYHSRFGMDVSCLRIGAFRPRPLAPEDLAGWLSPDDAARLVEACLRAGPAGFRVLWGISRNTRRWWSLAEGEAIGYRPQDDAEDHLASLLDSGSFAPGDFDPGAARNFRVGGTFCTMPLG
ncbi:NAD-dependent epimerase/dehydratase family protein [Streptomyces sp. NPDC020917]|uniref:NAD-dependent epimerase/dehydratase family protein n=1 Tax=Streptomyces sp. NPDC020917 TaxID=3365102 RepID=UPI00379491DB